MDLGIVLWWAALLLLTLCAMPICSCIFRKYDDRGYLFAKSTGLFLAGVLLFTANSMRLVRFRTGWILAAVLLLLAASVFFMLRGSRGKYLRGISLRAVFAEEAVFLVLFLVWVWIIGFRPGAYGTEKFMDYGFMTSMMRADYMPFPDPWFAGESVNYYYGGQFFAAFLTKMTKVTAGEGYTLMRAAIAAYSFCAPYALARMLLTDRFMTGRPECPGPGPAGLVRTGAVLSGLAAAYAGNGHYFIYGILLRVKASLDGSAVSYWFPDSTRFIGYASEGADKTIHEFPAYSTVLGDLHAHYVNLLFVVTVAAIAYAYSQNIPEKKVTLGAADAGPDATPEENPDGQPADAGGTAGLRDILGKAFLFPEIWLIALFTGLFRWTNFWDFPIYVVVCGAVVFFANIGRYKDMKVFLPVMALQTALVFAGGVLAALPFTLTFDQISSEIAPVHSHTSLYEFMVLWAFPLLTAVLFAAVRIAECRKSAVRDLPAGEEEEDNRETGGDAYPEYDEDSDGSAYPVWGGDPDDTDGSGGRAKAADRAVLLFLLCAVGLILLPEIIYVKDIYGGEHYRANTMFKLTYQAFVLFGISMGYIFARFLADRRRFLRAAGAVGAAMIVILSGYTLHSVHAWFGDVWDPSERVHTDASVFVSTEYPEDFEAVNYINTHIGGQPVLLEADGDSYSDFCRISVATGLPTVLGWYTHEWLWRNDTEAVKERREEIREIYTSIVPERTQELVGKYNISYIYIGESERERYPELSEWTLRGLYDVYYEDDTALILSTGTG